MRSDGFLGDSMCIGVARGGQRNHGPSKYLEHIVILCFERRFSKQNCAIRLKSNILVSPKYFGPLKFLGWLRHLVCALRLAAASVQQRPLRSLKTPQKYCLGCFTVVDMKSNHLLGFSLQSAIHPLPFLFDFAWHWFFAYLLKFVNTILEHKCV